ncbi:MAG: RNA 2',3'-cyclic phosphodiesterase [Gemmatimonadetes bacterium]|nr:RNA 2',3'-cyclic phosphodiesterase [Gemmatimonadota bacterium]
MRLFVALNLPKKEKHRVYRASRPLREEGLPVRWVEPDTYHITLKFLGEVGEQRLEAVGQALDKVATSNTPLVLDLREFGAFPTIRRPRVLWIGVEATPALRCLKQDIEWALSDWGFQRDTQAFHPHISLGRANTDDGAGAFRGLDELAAGLSYRGGGTVRKIDLMRSRLGKGGASYSVHASYRLSG